MNLWQYFAIKAGKKTTHKWAQYFPIYERYFSEWKNKSLTFLEIGTCFGGSLEMWRNYFCPLAKIISIDINPNCAELQIPGTFIRIGDQSDPKFLQSVVDEFGVPDIVLDDGSHIQKHIQASFDFFYPLMHKNSIYMVEDLHTAYWEEYGGDCENTFVEFAKMCADKLNASYSRGKIKPDYITKQTLGVHFYDSMVVFEKGDVWRRDSILSIPLLKDKNIYIYGAGSIGKLLIDLIASDGIDIRAVIDSNPDIQGGAYNGIPILSPMTLRKNNDENMHIVICAKNYIPEIKQALESKGFRESVDFSYYSDYIAS